MWFLLHCEILEAKREDNRVDPSESPRGSGQRMEETDPPEVEDLEPFQSLLADQDDEAQSNSGIISEALSEDQSCLESDSFLAVRDRGVLDPDWEGLAISGLVESQFRQLRSLLPWNGPQSLDIRETLRESLHSMLSLDERSLYELSLPLPVEEAPEVVPETELVRARKIRISRTDGDVRMMAISKIRSILLSDCSGTELGKTLVPSKECTDPQSEVNRSINDAFSTKASTTLYKRACALSRFANWDVSSRPLEITEEKVYSYLRDLQDKSAGATAGSAFVESLRFLDGIARFTKVELNKVLSGRVCGLAHAMYLQKQPSAQRDAMPTWIIFELEDRMAKSDDLIEKCILGQLLWCYHSAGRWSDGQRLKTIEPFESGGESVLVCQSLGSKTSLSKESKTRLLPFVCLGSGLSKNNWGKHWIQARSDAIPPEDDRDYFLPSYSFATACWANTPMSSSEATEYLSEYIRQVDNDFLLDFRLGTHGLKSGFLTMIARSVLIKLSPSERRLAGHHLDPADRSMVTYSREAYVELMAKVLSIYRTIRDGRFNPDLSPGERVIAAADALTGCEDQDPQPHECEDPSESEDELDNLLEEAEPTNEVLNIRCMVPEWEDRVCVVHKKSGIVHCLRDHDTTECGPFLTPNYMSLGCVNQDDADDLECCMLCGRKIGSNQA